MSYPAIDNTYTKAVAQPARQQRGESHRPRMRFGPVDAWRSEWTNWVILAGSIVFWGEVIGHMSGLIS